MYTTHISEVVSKILRSPRSLGSDDMVSAPTCTRRIGGVRIRTTTKATSAAVAAAPAPAPPALDRAIDDIFRQMEVRFGGDAVSSRMRAWCDRRSRAPNKSARDVAKSEDIQAHAIPDEENADGKWTVSGWLRSLELSAVAAAALAIASDDPFSHVSCQLTEDDLRSRLEAHGLIGLAPRIWAGIESLRSQSASTGAALNDKFATSGGAFVMAFGSLDKFFGGLTGLVGPPTMFRRSLLAQMAREHTMQADSRMPFDTSNGVKHVTSEHEYEFVVAGVRSVSGKLLQDDMRDGAERVQAIRDYPEREGWRESCPERCRVPISMAELERRMAIINSALAEAKHTPLVLEEAVGGRLYTGRA